MRYEVYDIEKNVLIDSGHVGWVEGYRPFIKMNLEQAHTYEVKLILKDKDTYKLAHIELCDIN